MFYMGLQNKCSDQALETKKGDASPNIGNLANNLKLLKLCYNNFGTVSSNVKIGSVQ